jgi:zinc/manganese transport system substrate-binding protein
MKSKYIISRLLPVFGSILLLLAGWPSTVRAVDGKLNVVSTSADYAAIAEFIGGDRVEVSHLIHGDQDPHTVRPKPSLAQRLAAADVLIATGLDLEMWLPPLVDKSGNAGIREGQDGYVAANYGMELKEIPDSLDRGQGDVHCFGNPHLHTSPINARAVARNIAIGFIKNDPGGEKLYKERLELFRAEIDRRLFGEKLLKLVGSKTLLKLANNGKLVSFLQGKKYKGGMLIDELGGWMKKSLPLRNLKVVSYHKNWTYFAELFGVEFVAEVEPKPGIPPSARDVADLIERMTSNSIRIIFAANYFDENKVLRICEKVGATPVVVPLSVGGVPGVTDYFSLVDYWLEALLGAVK